MRNTCNTCHTNNLYTSKPNTWTLNETESAIFNQLDELAIPYQGIHHDHADTMEDCKLIESYVGGEICKNLFLCNRQETDYYLLMMPREKPFKTKFLSAQLGCSRLSFASEQAMEQYLHTIPGSVSAFELLFDKENHIQLVIDRDVMAGEYVCGHPGLSVSTLRVKKEDLLKYVEAVGHEPIYVDLPKTIED